MSSADEAGGRKRGLMLTFSNPASPELEAEYHRWYEQVHIPQLVEHVPGIQSASRYVCGEGLPHRYLAIYELEDDEEAIRAGMAAGTAAGKLERSAALQLDPPPVVVFVQPLDAPARET